MNNVFNFNEEEYLKCFSKNVFQLPLTRTSEDYYEDLNNILELYKTESSKIGIQYKKKIKEICEHLIQAIDKYYKGYPIDAYNEIDKIMSLLSDRIIILEKGTTNFYKPYDDSLQLFRMRGIEENRIYTRNEIFHTPYCKKESVASCRYSISGYPSLYLSTTLELCHAETSGGNYGLKIAALFKLERNYNFNGLNNFKVLDLATRPQNVVEMISNIKSGNSTSSGYQNLGLNDFLENYIFCYPIIAACSFIRKSKDRKYTFFPEYIVPQLLLQWIRKNTGDGNSNQYLCGIRYFSCSSKKSSDLGINYVFPVCNYSINDQYCNILSNSFILSEPVLLIKADRDYENLPNIKDNFLSSSLERRGNN